MSLAYLDTSALVKLVIAEPESDALRQVLTAWPYRISSEIAAVELVRVARRLGGKDTRLQDLAVNVLAGLALVPLARRVLLRAAQLDPPALRSLDALHLASALDLAPDIGVVFAYDRQLQQAAQNAGLMVQAPA